MVEKRLRQKGSCAATFLRTPHPRRTNFINRLETEHETESRGRYRGRPGRGNWNKCSVEFEGERRVLSGGLIHVPIHPQHPYIRDG